MFKLMAHLRAYSRYIFLAVIFLFAQAMAELSLPNLMSDVINNGMLKGDIDYILRSGLYMLGIALFSAGCSVTGSYLSARAGAGFGRDVRARIFQRVESYSLHEFDRMGTSSLITRTTNDVTQVQTVLVMGMRFLVFAPIICLGGIVMAWQKNHTLASLLSFVLPIMLLLIVLLAVWIVPLFKQMQVKLDRLNRVLRENLIGMRVIRAFNRLEAETNRFRDSNRDLTDAAIQVNKIMSLMQPMMIVTMNITTVAIIYWGGQLIEANEMALGDMVAFIQYTTQIMFSIIMVTMMFVMVPRAQASALRINEVLELKPEITDPIQPINPTEDKGSVVFEHVSFRYPGAEVPALSDISFASRAGEVTAIIGGTGSGKSTLVNLIPRFYDVESGRILVDGVDVRSMTQSELRSRIGYVPQSPVLFSGTIESNVKRGDPAATQQAIEKAVSIAQAEEFILANPQGFQAHVSQGATNLSGGQKQRLSIARALVRRPEIYIFDDSFSALDFRTDARLRAALRPELGDATVLVVAQRVATVMDADRILVLDQGVIVGSGTHRELMASCAVYREIVASQLSEEEAA